jgi:single-strand DNA-binding protein
MNTIAVTGNLTREPELRFTPSGKAVVKFGIAVNRFYTKANGEKVEATDFFNVNAWGSLAHNIAESLQAGARVAVSGRLQSRSWETEDGAKRSAVEIEAEDVAASLRWATVAIARAKRNGAQDWNTDEAPAEEAADPAGASVTGSDQDSDDVPWSSQDGVPVASGS